MTKGTTGEIRVSDHINLINSLGYQLKKCDTANKINSDCQNYSQTINDINS